MFGLFLESLNIKPKKSENQNEDISIFSSNQINPENLPNGPGNDIIFSPKIANKVSKSPGLQEPVSLLSIDDHMEQKKLRNPSPIHSKQLDDDPVFSIEELSETYSPNFRINRGQNTPTYAKSENYLFINGLTKNFDSFREGTFLAQNIPPSRLITISKQSLESSPQTKKALHFKNNAVAHSFGAQLSMRSDGDEFEEHARNMQKAWRSLCDKKRLNNSLLIEASKFGNLEMCRELLHKKNGDLKADVNFKGEGGWTPFHFACMSGNLELVRFFLRNETDIDIETKYKFTALHIAAQYGFGDIVQLLLDLEVDVNSKDIYKNTALHYASMNGHKEVVELLLRKPSTNITIKNHEHKTAYNLSCNQEIRSLFSAFMKEKKMLEGNFLQQVTIHSARAKTVSKMFDSALNKNKLASTLDYLTPKWKKVSSGKSNDGSDTKNSSMVISEFDCENASPGEKIGPHSFRVIGMIGKGSFGEVYLVEKRNTGVKYAMKVLQKSKIARHNLTDYAMTERNVLGVSNHPFIVKLNYAFQNPEKLFLILDFCPGGDLGEHLQRERKFSEEKARFYIAEVLLALEDLHKRDIIFRDLKPDNIVLDSEGHAKLTDFGLSKQGILENTVGAKSFCGSIAYLAPEMLKRAGHGKAVDWYLLGVLLYEMLTGIPPFYSNNKDDLFNNIQNGMLKMPTNLTADAKSLLQGLLNKNPAKRLGSGETEAEEIKEHGFFKGINWDDVKNRKLIPPVVGGKRKAPIPVSTDVFETADIFYTEPDKLNGWSFVAAQQLSS